MIDSAAPITTRWFQRRLDEATKDRNIQLRIVWAPSQVITRVIDADGNTQVYKKYPIIEGHFVPWVLGHFFRRNGVTVGYQKTGGLIVGDVLPTDLAVPNVERVNPAAHIFVIERRMPDAEQVHAKKRERALRNLGIDLFPVFNEDVDAWEWWNNISEHREDCCVMARSAGVQCRGLYREPDLSDIAYVDQALKVRDELDMKDRDGQIEQASRDMRDAAREYAQKDRAERLQNAGEIGRLAQISLEKTRVVLDPRKQFQEKPNEQHANASD